MRTGFAVRRCATLISALGTALLLGLGTTAPALAHNYLISSSPEEGENLDSTPDQVTLTFNDDVQEGGNAIVVTGPDDETYEEGDVQLDGETATTALRPLDAAGEYTVTYRIISADGHPIEEELAFTVSEDAAAENRDAAEDGQTADEQTADGQETAEQDGSGNEEGQDTAAPDPLSQFGPVGGVVVAIAVAALIVILLVRMRNRPGPGGDNEQG